MSTKNNFLINDTSFLSTLFNDQLGLNDDYLNNFKKVAHTKILTKKSYLIEQGTVCNFIGIVIHGTFRSFVRTDEEEFNNDFYFDQSFVSAYTSFLTQAPTNCNIQALTDAHVMYITYEQYNQFLQQDNAWFKLGKFISETFFIRKCKRETSFLKNSASGRLESTLSIYPGIEQKISQYHIASYLGIKPESLSRIKVSAR